MTQQPTPRKLCEAKPSIGGCWVYVVDRLRNENLDKELNVWVEQAYAIAV
jgi:hypothetical protein